jgi:hypothetical protein
MIPLIHVANVRENTGKTSFFIFKECPTSEYFHIIGQRKFGNSVSNFFLYLKKSGVKSYYNTIVLDGGTNVSLISVHEEKLWTCPVWMYRELCRRIPASDLHMIDSEYYSYDCMCNKFENYLTVIKNASFVPVGYEGYSEYGNYNECEYDYDWNFMGCDGWVSENY